MRASRPRSQALPPLALCNEANAREADFRATSLRQLAVAMRKAYRARR